MSEGAVTFDETREDLCPVCLAPISAKPAVLDETKDRWVHVACTRIVFDRHA